MVRTYQTPSKKKLAILLAFPTKESVLKYCLGRMLSVLLIAS